MARNRKASFEQVEELYTGVSGLFPDAWIFFMKQNHIKHLSKYTKVKIFPYVLTEKNSVWYPINPLIRLK